MKGNSKTKSISANPTLIRFDWAMKRLLRQKSNFTVLEGFLSVLLNEEVKIINIKESESNQEHPNDKFNRVDIFVENNHSELLIIELQSCEQVDYFLRMLYGVSKAITEHISKGDRYNRVRKVYHINIVYFDLGAGKDYVYIGSNEFRGLHYNDVLQLTKEQKAFFERDKRKNVNDVKDLFPFYYLICVKGFDNVANNSLDEWIYYLKNNDIPNSFTAPGLKEVRKRLQYDKLSEEEKRDYDHHLEQTQYERITIDTAIMKGLSKGQAERDRLKVKLKEKDAELKNKDAELKEKDAELKEKDAILKESQAEKESTLKNVVLNMHQSGYPIDTISSITGITQKEIKSMVKNATAHL